jgi:hypothetical protein
VIEEVCPSICYMLDERWGRLPVRCEEGPMPHASHKASMTGCEPEAELCWFETWADATRRDGSGPR